MDNEILKNMKLKTTDELSGILQQNDRNKYQDQTFNIIRVILEERMASNLTDKSKNQRTKINEEKNENINGLKENNKGNIMFCTNCGNEVQESAVACPKCGFSPRLEKKFCYNCGTELNEKQVMCIKCGVSLSDGKNNTPKTQDNSTIGGLGILCFLIPVLGLILYLVWKDEKPVKSSGAGKAALWGLIIGVVLYFIGFCSLALV